MTQIPKFEGGAVKIESDGVEAPTVRVPPALPGEYWQASCPSLPAAATTTILSWTIALTAALIEGLKLPLIERLDN